MAVGTIKNYDLHCRKFRAYKIPRTRIFEQVVILQSREIRASIFTSQQAQFTIQVRFLPREFDLSAA